MTLATDQLDTRAARADVYRVAHAALVVGGLRVGGGMAGLLVSLLAGAEARAAGIGAAFGLGASVIGLVSNNRWSFYEHPPVETLATVDTRRAVLVEAIRRALLPSTAGVAVFLLVSLAIEPILSAALAGILGGLGAVGLASCAGIFVWERRERLHLYADLSRPPQRYGAPR